MIAALFVGRSGSPDADVLAVGRAAGAAPRPQHAPSAADLLLDGLATAFTQGYAAGVPVLRKTLAAFSIGMPADQELRWLSLAAAAASYIWDDDRWEALTDRHVQLARDLGALSELRLALSASATTLLLVGNPTAAEAAVEEERAAAAATGIDFAPYGAMNVAAWRGDEDTASELIQAILRDLPVPGEGLGSAAVEWAIAVLHNGLGRYQEALAAAQRATQSPWVLGLSNWALVELVEAAAHGPGPARRRHDAYRRLAELTAASGTVWALGLEARSHAMVSDGDEAEGFYRESIARLGRTRIRAELARAHLLYGEWLRRGRRRGDAREQLRVAHQMLEAMGLGAFAERARRELAATGETVRKRTVETRGELTAAGGSGRHAGP